MNDPVRQKNRRQEGSGKGEADGVGGGPGVTTLAEGETESMLLQASLRVGVVPGT